MLSRIELGMIKLINFLSEFILYLLNHLMRNVTISFISQGVIGPFFTNGPLKPAHENGRNITPFWNDSTQSHLLRR